MKRKSSRRNRLIAGIILITICLLLSLSILSYHTTDEPLLKDVQAIQNMMGLGGAYVSFYLIKYTFGYAVIIPCLLLLPWGLQIIRGKPGPRLMRFTLYSLGTMFLISVGFALVNEFAIGGHPRNYEYSGLVGGFFASYGAGYLGKAGLSIVYAALVIILFVLWTHFPVWSVLNRLEKLIRHVWGWRRVLFTGNRIRLNTLLRRKKLRNSLRKRKTENGELDVPMIPKQKEPRPDLAATLRTKQATLPKDIPGTAPGKKETPAGGFETETSSSSGVYAFPGLALLDSPATDNTSSMQEEIIRQAKTLEETLLEFGVQTKVVDVQPGPVLTLYEVRPDTGVKINRILALQDDLALAMKAKGIRIIAPIPGKDAVGIEIPNQKPSMVYLKSLLSDPVFKKQESKLTIALGRTVTGEVYFADLAKMPHLLIAGSTGSGKSVGISTIITSILYKSTPRDVQFIMIDPKMLELSMYKKLHMHHLLTADFIDEKIVTKPQNAVMVLRSCVLEMEKRYEILARAGVRGIDDYNAKPQKQVNPETGEPDPPTLEKIVIIIDELADLMLVATKDVEEPIARLAQMARAVGIHMVLATQRPSVDVITGVIKANFPARIAYQVATKVDSRTILDMNGAEQLLGSGDMLYLPPGAAKPVRMQTAFVSQKETERVVDAIAEQPKFRKNTKLVPESAQTARTSAGFGSGDRDPLFTQAARLVVMHQQGSISLLQRRLKVGYSRAARLIDELEDAGIVGSYDGSKARQVLLDDDELERIL